MTPKPQKTLTDEDRILWSNVARSTTPLRGKTMVFAEPDDEKVKQTKALPPVKAVGKPVAGPIARPRNPAIDSPTRDKLKKGRVAIDGKIDLHGMRQADAHALLLGFLRRGFAEGRRHVLVITGKGASFGSEGVLRRAVPEWLATPSFRPLVSGYSDAARNHGGTGALYIRIARNPLSRTET